MILTDDERRTLEVLEAASEGTLKSYRLKNACHHNHLVPLRNSFIKSGLGWNLFYRPLIDHRGQPAMMWVGAGTIAICDVVKIYEQTTGLIWDNGKESQG